MENLHFLCGVTASYLLLTRLLEVPGTRKCQPSSTSKALSETLISNFLVWINFYINKG